MKIAFYVGQEAHNPRIAIGPNALLTTVALVTGYLDEELGHLEMKIHLKKGPVSSSLTASVASLAVNQAFEQCPEVPVRSINLKCDPEVPEWA